MEVFLMVGAGVFHSKTDYKKYISLAEEFEERAKRLHDEAKKQPINNNELFLKSAKNSRYAAKYYKLAARNADSNFFLKGLATSNYHTCLENNYKAIADFFYYSNELERAIVFYERNLTQSVLSVLEIPPEFENYIEFTLDYIRHTWEIYGVIFDCKGALAKRNNDWILAQKNFEISMKINGKMKQITHDNVDLNKIESTLYSIEREIHTCQTMLALKKHDLVQALKHAELAITSAEKALETNPTWIFYQKILIPTVRLKATLESYITLSNLPKSLERTYETTINKAQSVINNFLSYKFEQEVERYLRRECHYVNTYCRYKPPYLKKEIDVYASRGGKKTTITVCECKLRLGKKPIPEEEVEYFSNKIIELRKHEQQKANEEGRQVRINSWFVTNTDAVEDGAINLAKKKRIHLKKAHIPNYDRLLTDSGWIITNIQCLA